MKKEHPIGSLCEVWKTACTNLAYHPLEQILRQNYSRQPSLLKSMRFLAQSPARIIRVLQPLGLSDQKNRSLHETLMRYCCYDQRKRKNYTDTWDAIA